MTKSTCCYCGVGCGIEIRKRRDGSLDLVGDPDHPTNRGALCSKGRTLLHVVNARAERLVWPQVRKDRISPLRRTSWDDTFKHLAAKFSELIAAHGPDSVAFYVSGQCLTEEYYVANKLVKGFLGTNNIDTNSRLCMSSAVAGYKATLGADSVPTSYEDIESCDTFLIAGANPAWAHPIVFQRIERRKQADPERVRLICIDPRRSATAAVSDLHLPIRPGTDVALFHTMAAWLWRHGQIDQAFIDAHCDGWEALRCELEHWPVERGAQVCDVEARLIAEAAALLGGDRRFLSMWTMGLNQSAMGVDKNVALINLSLITGKIGKPGCGPFSLTGQPNAMGGREVGGLANLLPAHRNLANPEHRAEVAKFWGVPGLRAEPGLTATELVDATERGTLKAVWVICTNPIASLPHSDRVAEALKQLDLVVVQDCYPTDTTPYADVLLPAATWLEKTGTMTNSERRVTLLDKAVEPPGEAMADVEILRRFAVEMGFGRAFAWADEAAIYREHAALTAGTDCDVSGIDYQRLRRERSVQWPAPAGGGAGPARLYADRVFPTANRKAQLKAPAFTDRSEPLDTEFPLVLTTGRLRDQWHTQTKTGRVARLRSHAAVPQVEIHPDDAAGRGIADGDAVQITGRRGTSTALAVVTTAIRSGCIFLPMHWGPRTAGLAGRSNAATSTRIDPVSKEPDLKFAAVQVAPVIAAPRRIVVIGAGSAALGLVDALRSHGRTDAITVLGDEPEPIYNRVALPHLIDGSRRWDQLVRADETALAGRGVTLLRGRKVVAIDRAAKLVRDGTGAEHPYDVLVLATGSRANVPTSGPLVKPGAHGLRNRADAERIQAIASSGGLGGAPPRAIIQGAGLLGIELADSLVSLGCQVTILQRSSRLMGKQLDAHASTWLHDALDDRRIAVRLDTNLSSLTGDEAVTGVKLDSGEIIPCELFIFATGTTPNIELARAAGLPCGRGITVDAHLRTADPAIFAVGECAEFQGQSVGTTAGAEEQARHLAQFLRGNPFAPYRGSIGANILKLRGLPLASAGVTDTEGDSTLEVLTWQDPRLRVYQKAVVKDDRLIGVLMYGDTTGFDQHRQLIADGTELEADRAKLLRLGHGDSGGPRGKLICSCNQVGEDDLIDAVRTGCRDLASLCAKTRAGTSCGSCRPEITEVLAKVAAPALVGSG